MDLHIFRLKVNEKWVYSATPKILMLPGLKNIRELLKDIDILLSRNKFNYLMLRIIFANFLKSYQSI